MHKRLFYVLIQSDREHTMNGNEEFQSLFQIANHLKPISNQAYGGLNPISPQREPGWPSLCQTFLFVQEKGTGNFIIKVQQFLVLYLSAYSLVCSHVYIILVRDLLDIIFHSKFDTFGKLSQVLCHGGIFLEFW